MLIDMKNVALRGISEIYIAFCRGFNSYDLDQMTSPPPQCHVHQNHLLLFTLLYEICFREKSLSRIFTKNFSLQVWLTALMFDVCLVFKHLQQKLQKSELLILDVLTARDTALRELDIIRHGPIGGRKEEKYGMSNDDESEVRNARKSHSFVDGRKRSNAATRKEIVLSAINFLGEGCRLKKMVRLKISPGSLGQGLQRR